MGMGSTTGTRGKELVTSNGVGVIRFVGSTCLQEISKNKMTRKSP